MITKTGQNFLSGIWNSIFPDYCCGCGTKLGDIRSKRVFTHSPWCHSCHQLLLPNYFLVDMPDVLSAGVMSLYRPPVQGLINHCKEFPNKDLLHCLAPVIGESFENFVEEEISADKVFLIPAPSARRRSSPGCDLANLLAKVLGVTPRVDNVVSLVRYRSAAEDATLLSAEQRRTNCATNIRLTRLGRAIVRSGRQGKYCPGIIIDDVVTTGSTIEVTKKYLENYGFKIIGSFALAYTQKSL